MRSALRAHELVSDMPTWLYSALVRLTHGWYDPARAERQAKRTDHAVDDAAESRDRATVAIESYRRDDAEQRRIPRH
jgi:hypothetical protein